MPRPGPRRPLIAIRPDPDQLAQLKARAERETGGNLSELIRRLLKYALTRMPRGWRDNDQ